MSRSISLLGLASSPSFASSSSTSSYTSIRTYAAKAPISSSQAYINRYAPSTDSRADIIRSILYPPNTHLPKSASPTGAHHPDHEARIRAILPSDEYHETIERAWKLYRRHATLARQRAVRQKFEAMEKACDELEKITREGDRGLGVDRQLYHSAMRKNDPHARPKATGRRITPEQRWLESRMEGLWPRETWVPTETRGKGWNYDWKRPAGK